MSQDARYDEEQSTLRRARLLGYDYFDTTNPDKKLFKEILSNEDMYKLRIVPLTSDKSHINFGITTLTSQNTLKTIKERFLDQRISFAIISDTGFRDYMRLFDPPKETVYQDIKIDSNQDQVATNQISAILTEVKASDMLAYLVSQAHRLVASDIHIETQAEEVRIRFRIDGVLHLIARLQFDKYRILLSAIASAANLSTASQEAQQGHIAQKVEMADHTMVDVNVRVETVLTVNGMDIVMRLFNMHQDMYNLDRLGLSEQEREIVDNIISKPNGLVLIVGPTGSGKTTTLYSMLNSLNSEQRKIITIEDPVEYQFKGISQISITGNSDDNQTNFSDQLKAVLRLDPDVIMIGEIRDEDTAKTALQAALTGHLVLATFHAGSAAAALTRLSFVIGQNPLFISAIRLIMAQRLVRKLDESSKSKVYANQQEMESLKRLLQKTNLTPEQVVINEQTVICHANPSVANPYGFKGQVAIREQYSMTEMLKEEIVKDQKSGSLSTDSLDKAAMESGIVNMYQDALIKILNGVTTIEEVSRVLDY